MGMVQEFKEFATKGSLIDMAVGIIIGVAVSDMIGALVDNVIMPIVGIFLGGGRISNKKITVGEASIGYGAFVQAIIDFLIIAFVIFMILKVINRMKQEFAAAQVEEAAPAPADIQLLSEIRDLLKKNPTI